jgi:hypothetical protein
MRSQEIERNELDIERALDQQNGNGNGEGEEFDAYNPRLVEGERQII